MFSPIFHKETLIAFTAYVFMAMKSMFDLDIPNNDGCTTPTSMKTPLGSVVNCKFPADTAIPWSVTWNGWKKTSGKGM